MLRTWRTSDKQFGQGGTSLLSTVKRSALTLSVPFVSMAGIVGTLGMLAEASGCGAVLDVARDLSQGAVAVFPTETVYGIGASAFSSGGIRRDSRLTKANETL